MSAVKGPLVEGAASPFPVSFAVCCAAHLAVRLPARLFLHLHRVLFHLGRGESAVARRRHDLAQRLDADVARCIESLDRRPLLAVGHDVAVLIKLRHSLDEVGRRQIARKHEHPEGVSAFGCEHRALARGEVLPCELARQGVALDRLDFRLKMNRNLFVVACGLRRRRSACEVLLAHEDRHMLRILREEDALLRSRKAAADDEDILAREEFAVARRTVGDAMPAKFLLAHEADLARMCARREQYGERLIVAAARMHMPSVALLFERGDLGEQELRAEPLRLTVHLRREVGAARRLAARIVHDLRRQGDLTAEFFLFHHEHTAAGSCQVKRGGQPRRAAADHYCIIKLVFLRRHLRALPRGRASASASWRPAATSPGKPRRRALRRTCRPEAFAEARRRCGRRCPRSPRRRRSCPRDSR